MKEKRYVVSIDAYVYAQDDEHARLHADEYAKYLRCMERNDDNRAEVTGLCEQPFGTFTNRSISL